MTMLLQKEIEKIKKHILALGAVVEEQVEVAVQAVEEHSETLAQKVIEADAEVDEREVDLEEECLKLLALYQPVANDLRFLVSVIKINSDLERIGDLAVNIAERAAFLSTQKRIPIPFDFAGMAKRVKMMLRKSLDSLVNTDLGMAFEVWKADDEVDSINRDMYSQVAMYIQKDPDQIHCFLQLLSVGRQLERIADHATNIAEDVIYMIKGDIVRHKPENYRAKVGEKYR